MSARTASNTEENLQEAMMETEESDLLKKLIKALCVH
jgi:hypothetical protein